jgi:hypothetical protein
VGRAQVEESRKKKTSGGQKSFLNPNDMPESDFYNKLRGRYVTQARLKVVDMIIPEKHVDYDRLWLAALSYPMVWESDLRQWLKQWRADGNLEWHGLAQRGRELLRGKNHSVVLKSGTLR